MSKASYFTGKVSVIKSWPFNHTKGQQLSSTSKEKIVLMFTELFFFWGGRGGGGGSFQLKERVLNVKLVKLQTGEAANSYKNSVRFSELS